MVSPTTTSEDTVQQQEKPQDEYLTVDQYCALVRIVPKTAQRQRLNGDGPPWVRASQTRVLYRRSDVDAWLASRTFRHRAAEAVGLSAA